ncbi:unnamed protein product [marine sediment metagenome]|uniref:Uncharacterized protein n=1 Tax=marine sediment metagenome TaxID=412755 RepID=X1HNY8_9ZZZZ
MGIASNLRTCRYDLVICLSLSDKIGSKVYGQAHIMGTTYAGASRTYYTSESR